MRPLWLILAGLAAIGVLSYFCYNMHRPEIETDLLGKVRGALEKAGLTTPTVEANGRRLILRGTVPDEATKIRAGVLAAEQYGVVDVINELVVPAVAAAPAKIEGPAREAALNCQQIFNDLLGSQTIQFETGRAVIAAASNKLLDTLAETAGKCPAAEIEIGGHTDPRGSLPMNMTLSQRRADAVVAYLTRKGVAGGRLSGKGYGPTQPIADNATPEGMQKNRRTEFKVKGI
jgi:outer membrane protein OmpA-like peptidoglycan-associated protein